MFGGADVCWDPGSDLVLAMEECRTGARYPRRKEACSLWSYSVDGFGLFVGKYVYLCIWGQCAEWFVFVLMAFHVKYVSGDGDGGDCGADCL